MAKDIFTDEDWESVGEKRTAPPPKLKRPAQGGGGGGTTKDYLIVALIAIIAVMGINNFIYARSAPSGFGCGGGCYSGGGRGGGATVNVAQLEQAGLEFYLAQTGDEDIDSVQAQVQDFGCHQEIFIHKNGEMVMRVGYANGQVFQM